MSKKQIKFTIAEFAKLNNINKRTLQYYDNIGLFSPITKGQNNYRYYNWNQILELNYILMLRELGMSIKEIKKYIKLPTSDNFQKLTQKKIPEINNEIKRLQKIKEELKYKKNILTECSNITNSTIEIKECEEEYLLIANSNMTNYSLEDIYNYLRETTNTKKQILGYGSFIDWNKILHQDYDYDGIFTYIKSFEKSPNLFVKEKGKYLCAYYKGSWTDLPKFYNKIIEYTQKNNITLTGNVYEIGLNDFIICPPNDYITKITIKVKDN